jgi:hypothetical protein
VSVAVRCRAGLTSVPISARAQPSRPAIWRCVSPRRVQLSSFSVRRSRRRSERCRSISRSVDDAGAISAPRVRGSVCWFLASSLTAMRRVTEATHARGFLTAMRCRTKASRTSCATSSGDRPHGQRRAASRRARCHKSVEELIEFACSGREGHTGSTKQRHITTCAPSMHSAQRRPYDGRVTALFSLMEPVVLRAIARPASRRKLNARPS